MLHTLRWWEWRRPVRPLHLLLRTMLRQERVPLRIVLRQLRKRRRRQLCRVQLPWRLYPNRSSGNKSDSSTALALRRPNRAWAAAFTSSIGQQPSSSVAERASSIVCVLLLRGNLLARRVCCYCFVELHATELLPQHLAMFATSVARRRFIAHSKLVCARTVSVHDPIDPAVGGSGQDANASTFLRVPPPLPLLDCIPAWRRACCAAAATNYDPTRAGDALGRMSNTAS